MPPMIRVLSFVVPVMMGIACGHPRVPVRGTIPLSGDLAHIPRLLAAKSPLIVIGTISAFRSSDKLFITDDPRRYPVRLARIRLTVENVLRGNLDSDSIDVLCYKWAGDYIVKGQNIDYGAPPIGARRMYFLDREPSGIRCYQDIYSSFVPVYSGRHYETPVTPSVNIAIAQFLLEPGADVDIGRFADPGIRLGTSIALDLVGPLTTFHLISRLRDDKREIVRDWACAELSLSIPGQDRCADEASSRQPDPGITAVLTTARRNRVARDDFLLQSLKEEPLGRLAEIANNGDSERVADAAILLTYHRNPAIRKQACSVLRRYFPDRRTNTCEKRGVEAADPQATRR